MRTVLCAAIGLPLALTPLALQDTAPRETAPEPTADEAAVRAAVENYVLAFYDAEPERLERALSPDVKKLGFWRDAESGEYGDALHMDFEAAVALATRWNAEGQYGDDLDHEIVLHEVADKTATAKLTAYWGHDYFQLAKGEDGWRVHHILWQSHPPE